MRLPFLLLLLLHLEGFLRLQGPFINLIEIDFRSRREKLGIRFLEFAEVMFQEIIKLEAIVNGITPVSLTCPAEYNMVAPLPRPNPLDLLPTWALGAHLLREKPNQLHGYQKWNYHTVPILMVSKDLCFNLSTNLCLL